MQIKKKQSRTEGGISVYLKIQGWISWAWDSAVSVLQDSLYIDKHKL